MMIFNLFWLVLLLFYVVRNPSNFAILYLVFISSYGGLFSNDILFNGVEYGQLSVNLIALLGSIYHWKYSTNFTKKIVILISIFLIYGLLKPIYDGYQGLVDSIRASKSMSFYFFVFYALVNYRYIRYEKVFKFIIVLSTYFSLLYIFNAFGFSIRPLAYLKETAIGIQCYYDSFILFAIVILLSFPIVSGIKLKILLSILIIGLYIGGFFSLLCSAIGIVAASMFASKIKHKLTLVLFVSLGIVFVFLMQSIIYPQFSKVIENQQIALSSRDIINEFRFDIIEQQKWLGYGFLDKGSSPVILNATNVSAYTESLSVIDSGYVDLLGRYGIIGTAIFLLIPLAFIRLPNNNIITNPFCLILLFFYAVNLTWSVFTFQMGIIVLAFAYSYLFKEYGSSRCDASTYV